MTVKRMTETMENTAITFIVNCLGVKESYTDILSLNREWGKEEVANHFMINTRELMINIK